MLSSTHTFVYWLISFCAFLSMHNCTFDLCRPQCAHLEWNRLRKSLKFAPRLIYQMDTKTMSRYFIIQLQISPGSSKGNVGVFGCGENSTQKKKQSGKIRKQDIPAWPSRSAEDSLQSKGFPCFARMNLAEKIQQRGCSQAKCNQVLKEY